MGNLTLRFMRMAKGVLFLVTLWVSLAHGQDVPDSPHLSIGLVAGQTIGTTADVYFTYRNMERPDFHEHNLLARPFTENRTVFVASSAAGLILELFTERYLMRHGHHKLARNLSWVVIGGHAFGAYNSARQGGF
jgi:hypothetical protein